MLDFERSASVIWRITGNTLISEFHLSNYSGSLWFVTKHGLFWGSCSQTCTRSYCSSESEWIMSLVHFSHLFSHYIIFTSKASQEASQRCSASPPHNNIHGFFSQDNYCLKPFLFSKRNRIHKFFLRVLSFHEIWIHCSPVQEPESQSRVAAFTVREIS